MPFYPPDGADLERQLIFGASDSGKTHIWMSIALMYVRTKTPGTFWVIDNDNTTKRMMGPRGQFHQIADICDVTRISSPSAFEEYEEFNERVLNDAEPDDWIIVDMSSNVWQSMPSWWIKNVYGETHASYFSRARAEALEREKEGKKDERIGGQKGPDWSYLSPVYLGWEKQISIHQPCHVMFLSAEKAYTEFNDRNGELRAFYSITNEVGAIGQPQQAHRFHTVMRAAKETEKSGRKVSVKARTLTMVKDRDREELWEEHGGRGMTIDLSKGPLFPRDYLMKFAGWSVRRG